MLCNYHLFIISPSRLILITAIWDGKDKIITPAGRRKKKVHRTETIQFPVATDRGGSGIDGFYSNHPDRFLRVLSDANDLQVWEHL